MHQFINHNGSIIDVSDASISPANAGLLHGAGIFTTLRIYHGKPFLYFQHWQRLTQNASAINLSIDNWPAEKIQQALLELIKANNCQEGKARITLLQTESRYWRINKKFDDSAELLIFTAPLSQHHNDLALTISPYRVNSASPLAGVKVIGNLQQIITLREVEARGFNEAIVLNERAEVCEAAAANIFWVRNGVIYTPTQTTGCLPGITRRLLISLADKLRIELSEGAYQADHLLAADEVFLTSATRELTRVSAINAHQYSNDRIFERLYRAYQEQLLANDFA